jgi:hypothetical protein
MANDQSPTHNVVPADDLARFHRNAPAALARRGRGYVAESLLGSFEMVALGSTPIVGLVWFGWSAAEQLAFLLIGAWVGITCDLARLAFAGRGVQEFAKRAMMGARGMLGAAGLLRDRSLLASMAAFTAYQAASAAWEIVRHRRAGPDAGPVEAQPGVRGVGLFVLMFVVLIAGDPEAYGGIDARRVMLVVNGAIVLIGVLNSAAIVWLNQETVWLRTYLASQPAPPVDVQPPAKRKRRRRKR